MSIRRARRPRASLDMTPMIDCVFQLLIFFMLSSSMIAPWIRLTLPHATTKDDADHPEIVVSATAKGELSLNQDPVTLEQLGERLRPLLARSKTKAVTFRGDRKVDFELFVKTLDAARQSGAAHLNVMHE